MVSEKMELEGETMCFFVCLKRKSKVPAVFVY